MFCTGVFFHSNTRLFKLFVVIDGSWDFDRGVPIDNNIVIEILDHGAEFYRYSTDIDFIIRGLMDLR